MRHSAILTLFLLLSSCAARPSDTPPSRPQMASFAFGCGGCHGTSGQGYGSIPRIDDKTEVEFLGLMQDFRADRRRNTVMNRIARGYSDADFTALAKYFVRR